MLLAMPALEVSNTLEFYNKHQTAYAAANSCYLFIAVKLEERLSVLSDSESSLPTSTSLLMALLSLGIFEQLSFSTPVISLCWLGSGMQRNKF